MYQGLPLMITINIIVVVRIIARPVHQVSRSLLDSSPQQPPQWGPPLSGWRPSRQAWWSTWWASVNLHSTQAPLFSSRHLHDKNHLDGWFEGDVVHLSFTRSFPLMDPGPSTDNPSGPSEILKRFHEAANAFRKVDYQWKYIGGTQVLPFGGPRVPQLTIHLVWFGMLIVNISFTLMDLGNHWQSL